MREIDLLASAMGRGFDGSKIFPGIGTQITEFAEAAKHKCETLRTDPDIFDIWTDFVVAGERLSGMKSELPTGSCDREVREMQDGKRIIEEGKILLTYIVRARVAMPDSTRTYINKCNRYIEIYRGSEKNPWQVT